MVSTQLPSDAAAKPAPPKITFIDRFSSLLIRSSGDFNLVVGVARPSTPGGGQQPAVRWWKYQRPPSLFPPERLKIRNILRILPAEDKYRLAAGVTSAEKDKSEAALGPKLSLPSETPSIAPPPQQPVLVFLPPFTS